MIGLLITTSAVAHEVDRATEITRYCATEVSLADSELDYIQTVDLNRRGQVLGWGYLDVGVEVFLWDRKHGYKFIDALAHEVEIPVKVAAFNDRGQIVSTLPIEPDGAFLRAVIWQQGKDLKFLEPAPGDDSSVAVDINNRGEVAGISGPYPDESAVGERPVIWDRHGRVTVIPMLPDSESGRPYAMNDAGQVIGASYASGDVLGYIWDRKNGLRMIEGLPGDKASVPSGINDHGEVVGTGSFNGGGQHAVFWSEATGTVDLGDLPGGPEISHASDINNHRQIVGYATGQGSTVAVIWDSEGKIHNLNDLLVRDEPEVQSLFLGSAREINDAGWITASSRGAGQQFSNLVLKPARRSPTGTYDCPSGK
jgi:probable HAF family extracellular repeat protein